MHFSSGKSKIGNQVKSLFRISNCQYYIFCLLTKKFIECGSIIWAESYRHAKQFGRKSGTRRPKWLRIYAFLKHRKSEVGKELKLFFHCSVAQSFGPTRTRFSTKLLGVPVRFGPNDWATLYMRWHDFVNIIDHYRVNIYRVWLNHLGRIVPARQAVW